MDNRGECRWVLEELIPFLLSGGFGKTNRYGTKYTGPKVVER